MTLSASLVRLRPVLWFAALALLIVLAEYTVTQQPIFLHRTALPLAVAFDMLVVVPALFYVMVVRRYRLPLSTVAAAVSACVAVIHWLLPAPQQPAHLLHWLPVALEGLTLSLLVIKARRLVEAYQAAGASATGFLPRARTALQQVLGKAGVLLVFEVDMLRYAVLGWWAKPQVATGSAPFSNYRESGFFAFAITIGAVIAIEATVVHLLVGHWSARLAFCLLFFDGYTLVTLVAHGHAVRLNPTVLTTDTLVLRVGFAWELTVPRAAIVAMKPLREAPPTAADLLSLTKLLFTTPNLLLTFAEPVTVVGPYGIRRMARQVAVYLDHPQQFSAAAGFCS